MKERSLKQLFKTPNMPHLMSYSGSEQDILKGIKNGSFFGFIVADVTTPDDLLDEILPINFPPIIIRDTITEDMVGDYMKGRLNTKESKAVPCSTLLQKYNAKNVLLLSTMAKFYLELGMEISNITTFIQYRPAVVLDPFVKTITNGRISAKKAGNESLELAYKVIGNRLVNIKLEF